MEQVLWNEEGGGKLSFHFCFDPQTVEVIFRAVVFVNQLRIYGAVADMCEELASRISCCSASTERLVAKDKPETMVAPTAGRHKAHVIRALFKINDVQGTAIDFNDLLNTELQNDNLRLFDQALAADVGKELEKDLLQVFFHSTL